MLPILAQISKVLLTRNRRPCRRVDTKPITRFRKRRSIITPSRHIDNERGRENLLRHSRLWKLRSWWSPRTLRDPSIRLFTIRAIFPADFATFFVKQFLLRFVCNNSRQKALHVFFSLLFYIRGLILPLTMCTTISRTSFAALQFNINIRMIKLRNQVSKFAINKNENVWKGLLRSPFFVVCIHFTACYFSRNRFEFDKSNLLDIKI